MRLIHYDVSDTGRVRQINQDAVGVWQDGEAGLYVVADGMGGHADGEKASRTVVEELADWWKSFSPDLFHHDFRRMLQSLMQALEHANQTIYNRYNRTVTCGTTVTALLVCRNDYAVVYAGDSRCYISRGLRWDMLTVDEVWENQSDLSSSERASLHHPNRGKLVNAVGVKETLKCRSVTDQLTKDAVFLLCSDGLYKYCSARALQKSMKRCTDRGHMEKEAAGLLREVYQNGADDNVSFILVRYCAK